MVAYNEPIASIVTLANLEEAVLPQTSIRQEVLNLVDLIKIRVSNKPIAEVANGLLEDTFALRVNIFRWLAANEQDLHPFSKRLNSHIAKNLQLSHYSALADTLSRILLSYQSIVSPLFEQWSGSLEDIVKDINEQGIEYNSFKLISLHPAPQIRALKNWVDASLHLEAGLIVADLLLTNQVQLPKDRIETELTDFLYQSITRFGAFSIFTGFWVPRVDDTSPLVNSMKILSSTLELDAGKSYRLSGEDFFNLVNN